VEISQLGYFWKTIYQVVSLYLALSQIELLSFRTLVRNLLETSPLLDIKRYDKKAQFMVVFSILKDFSFSRNDKKNGRFFSGNRLNIR
jgi:hypothetical protein